MNKCAVTLFYRNPARDDCKGINRFIADNNLGWGPYSENGFSIRITNDLRENLRGLLSDNMDAYPNSVLTSDKKSERVVRSAVRDKGGLFARIEREDLTFMRKINYGIQKSDFYRILEVAGYGCKAIGF